MLRRQALELGNVEELDNHNFQTCDPDIYAVGDAIESFNSMTHQIGKNCTGRTRTASGKNRGRSYLWDYEHE